MRIEHYETGSESRAAWAAGRGTCPECKRFGCRGQCGCGCPSCKATPVTDWSAGCCDVIREMRERATPEGREAQRKRYLDELNGRTSAGVSWGECVSQVERVGCPHGVVAIARRPEPRLAFDRAKTWWNQHRGAQPALVLSGGTGTGKSVAAAWVAIKFAEARRWWSNAPTGPAKFPLVWLPADNLARLSLLRDEDEELLERCGAAELLVVDELSAFGGKAGMLALSQLLTRRLDSRKPLVITTNAGAMELAVPLGAHFVDRLNTACIVKLDEKSQRRRS